jgi:hypothetical protein
MRELGPIKLKLLDIPHMHVHRDKHQEDMISLIFEELQSKGSLESYGFGSVKAFIEIRWEYLFYRIVVL